MPKRKSSEKIDNKPKEISLKDITGIGEDLGITTTAEKESQTETSEFNNNSLFEDETNHYLFLEIIANDLELSDIIIESVDGDPDQIDVFKETIKQLVEKLFNEIKSTINHNPNKSDNKNKSLSKH